MKAFISHSSKDKSFVRQVASTLGPLQIEFDEQTFEFTLNTQAIRNALKRSDLVVFFISKNSISSNFVAEEQRQALEARGRGGIRDILIFSIDETSYKALPAWLREINIVQQISNPKHCARRIQARLIDIDAKSQEQDIYIGRDSEERDLRKALAAPSDKSPIALHAVGFHGIGRRTFLKNTLHKLFPRYYSIMVEITISQYQSAEDLYRSLYNLHIASSRAQMIDDFEAFSRKSDLDQAKEIVNIIIEMSESGEFIFIVDEGGVYDESGEYHQYWDIILRELAVAKKPILAFIQNRMQPYRLRVNKSREFHQSIGGLNEESCRELVGFSLKMAEIDYTEKQLSEIISLVDGHPFNLRFLIGHIKSYGIENILRDPKDFNEWKHKRGEDFLAKLDFTESQGDIIACLAEYRYIGSELLILLLEKDVEHIMEDLRNLMDICCVEHRDGYFHLAGPIREATRRDTRFERDEEWRKRISEKIFSVIKEYRDDDNIPVSIIEAAAIASVRGTGQPEYINSIILPSHLLTIAKDLYDRQSRVQAIAFCKQAYGMKERMTIDAQVETLRLWALSAARANEVEDFKMAMEYLLNYGSPVARRVRLFLEGFHFRIQGRLAAAEEKYKSAWNMSRNNAHINRELAQLYCRQKRYDEAEEFARFSYRTQPTNPFIIDIFLETLLGKKFSGQKIDENEVDRLMADLEIHGNSSGKSFFLTRKAQNCYYQRQYDEAEILINKALEQTPNLTNVHFLNIDILIGKGDITGAEYSLNKVRILLRNSGQSEGDEARLLEAEVDILLEKRQYTAAKTLVERTKNLSSKFTSVLLIKIARSISHDSSLSNEELRRWSAKQLRRQTNNH